MAAAPCRYRMLDERMGAVERQMMELIREMRHTPVLAVAPAAAAAAEPSSSSGAAGSGAAGAGAAALGGAADVSVVRMAGSGGPGSASGKGPHQDAAAGQCGQGFRVLGF